MTDTELDRLEAAFFAAVEAHKTHPPHLRRDRDGIYRCAACNPGQWWGRPMDWLLFTRPGKVTWWATGGAAIYGLTLLFQHLGWYR